MRTYALSGAVVVGLLVLPAPARADERPVVLAAQVADGVVLLDPHTGARQRLVVPGGEDPAVSPDGTRLAFGLRDGRAVHLFVSNVDGTDKRQVTSGPSYDADPDFSPDGTRLALTRHLTAGGPAFLAVVGVDGTGGHRVPGSDGATVPSWSPDGELLAFAGPDFTAGVIGEDGRNRQRLEGAGGVPDWSPDGRTLAVARRGGDDSDVPLYDLQTRRSRVVTPFQGYHVSWRQAVYAADGSIYTDISTESFPDENGSTTTGGTLEHRRADGDLDSGFWAPDLASNPGPGGGPAAPRDPVAPGPVAATATVGPGRIDLDTAGGSEPDAAGAVVRYAAGDVAPVTVSDGLPGGRSLSGRTTLSGLEPSTAYAVSVFAVDWSGNAGPRTELHATTPREVPTALDLSSSAGEVRYGSPVLLTGVLTRNGRAFAGAPVALYGHRSGEPDALLARSTTDDAGRVQLRRVPTAATRYMLRYAEEGDVLPASDTGVVSVRVAVAATLSRTSVRRRGAVTVRAQVRPATPGGVVRVEQRLAGRLVAGGSVRQDRAGVVRYRLDTSRTGAQQVQVHATARQLYEGQAQVPLTVR